MRLLVFLLLVFAGIAALAIWLLPLWLSLSLIVLSGVPLAWAVWKVTSFIKKLKKGLADFIPQEKLCVLAAGEPFRGYGFAFTFPIPCEVSQTRFDDVEALLLKPRFDFPGAPKDSLVAVSTFPKDELKGKINETIERIFSQIQESRAEEYAPLKIGSLEGERRGFAAAKDGKSIKGEAVYLGDQDHSIVWVAIAPEDAFEPLAAQYRELVCLIQRVAKSEPAAS
jgi:hypothetical protein